MKPVLKLILLFSLAILLAILGTNGPGHVVILIKSYRIDLSLATLIFCTLFIYTVIYYSFIISGGIYHIPYRISRYRHKMALIKSHSYSNVATNNYFLTNYDIAYNNALKVIGMKISAENKFPMILLAIDTINLMDGEDDKKSMSRIDRLLKKLSSKAEVSYISTELTKINKIRNNKWYAEVLAKLAVSNSI